MLRRKKTLTKTKSKRTKGSASGVLMAQRTAGAGAFASHISNRKGHVLLSIFCFSSESDSFMFVVKIKIKSQEQVSADLSVY